MGGPSTGVSGSAFLEEENWSKTFKGQEFERVR